MEKFREQPETRLMPFLLVLSAKSGGGETTIAEVLLQAREELGTTV